MRSRIRSPRLGITMIEVLVTIGIIGILFSLLTPAIGAARSTAHKTQCISNLRQIGVANLAFESAESGFPAFYFQQELLPYIDQKPLFDAMNTGIKWTDEEKQTFLSTLIPLYQCPADPASSVYATFAGTNYVANSNWVIIPSRPRLRVSELLHGSSNAVLISETLRPTSHNERMRTIWAIPDPTGAMPPDQLHAACEVLPPWPETVGFLPAGSRGTCWTGGAGDGLNALWYHHRVPPNRPNCQTEPPRLTIFPAISVHSGGVHALYADGHVDFISEFVDAKVWLQAGQLARRQPFSPTL